MKFTLEDMIKELARELAMRKSFYKKQIELRKMTKDKANKQYGAMEAALKRLEQLKINEGNQTTLGL